jgi:hypothetical protein
MTVNEWPRCDKSIDAFFDVFLVCVLPLGHEYDGQTAHRDQTGAEWAEV